MSPLLGIPGSNKQSDYMGKLIGNKNHELSMEK